MSILPARIKKPSKQATRWRSPAHRAWVRSHACSACGSQVNIEAAHVRIAGNGSMGQKPDDFYCVSLCGGPDGCHSVQHRCGERTFWKRAGIDVEALIEAFCRESPKALEIARVKRERADAS